jgi:hypothetical protein
MQKLLAIIVISFTSIVVAVAENETLRKTFIASTEDATKTDALLQYFEKINRELSPLELAYNGAAYGLKAKHASNPYNKIKYVNKSLEMLERAIEKDSENIEIRYLRFSVERNLPLFLNNSKNIPADLETIVLGLSKKKAWTLFEIEMARDILDSKKLKKESAELLSNRLNKGKNA